MSISNFVAQVAPMNHVAKVALQEQESANIKLLALQQVIQETLKKEQEKIEKPVPSEAGPKLRRRDEKQKGNPEQQSERQGQARDELAELFDGSESEGDVWSGNIVNVRI